MDWQKAERKGIAAAHAQHHRDSGRGTRKGDGHDEYFTIEEKSCKKTRLITGAMIEKARKDARVNGQDWAILVVPRLVYAHMYVVIDRETYMMLGGSLDGVIADNVSSFSLPPIITLAPNQVMRYYMRTLGEEVVVIRLERFNELRGLPC